MATDLLNLFADLVAETKAQKADKKKAKQTAIATAKQYSPYNPASFKPVLIQHRIIVQECACGARHEYFSGQFVRREKKRDSLSTSILRRESLPMHEALDLPQQVDYEYEYVPVCPSCISTAQGVDYILGLSQQHPQQLQLFS